MDETLERHTPTGRVNGQAPPRRAAMPQPIEPANSSRAPRDEVTPVAAGADTRTTTAARAGLRAEEARWLPLLVPGFALLLLACTALIFGMAAAGA